MLPAEERDAKLMLARQPESFPAPNKFNMVVFFVSSLLYGHLIN